MPPELRRCLIDLDLAGLRAAWVLSAPHLPQPVSDGDVLASAHMARTAAQSVPLRQRAYSHRWLTERELPSQLPDHLKPAAERIYPRIAGAVGISVNSRYREVCDGVRGAMEHAVLDAYADNRTDPAFVKARMLESRARELRGLGLTRRGGG